MLNPPRFYLRDKVWVVTAEAPGRQVWGPYYVTEIRISEHGIWYRLPDAAKDLERVPKHLFAEAAVFRSKEIAQEIADEAK